MSEVLEGLVIAVAIYWTVAGLWWSFFTMTAHDKVNEARWNHNTHEKLLTQSPWSQSQCLELERSQKVRDTYLREGRELAEIARKAPIWLGWCFLQAIDGVRLTLTQVNDVRLGRSEMDTASLRDQIQRTEDELQRLKDEQERT